MIPPASAINWVWGASVPLPPPLAEGWEYEQSPADWLMARAANGDRFFVGCVEGDYFLIPERIAEEGNPGMRAGEIYADTENVCAFPVA